MAPLFPIMIALTLITLVFQVRSISAMVMVFATAPLGLIGVVPALLLFREPFGINALVGQVALSGILMRNTLILIGQIHNNAEDGLSPFDAVVEATEQRARPVILTALAAILAFIPLHFVEPVVIRRGRYIPLKQPGYGVTMKENVLQAFEYPNGVEWADVVRKG